MNLDPMSKWERLTTELNKAFNNPKDSPDEKALATTTAAEAATEEQSSNVEITSGCSHPCPPELQSKPGSRKLCPPCLIDDHISDIQAIKIAFERRGGIFESKTHFALPMDLRHKDYVKMWTVAKIECYRDIELLEYLRDKDLEQAKELGVLGGLERWEQAREESCRVPGYKYIGDQIDELEPETEPAEESQPHSAPEPAPVEDNESGARVRTSRPATPEEIEALLVENREYHVVATKPKKKKRHNVNLTTGSAIDDTSTIQTGDLASPDDEVLQEMEGVTKRLDQCLSMGKWDLFDVITVSETEALQNNANRSDSPPTPPLTPITPKTVALPSTLTQRSALKGSRSSPPSNRTMFSNNKSILTPKPFPSIEEAHSKHTNAEDARTRGNFHRTSPWYREGSWASSDDFEKEDTSFMRMTWFRYEKYVRVPTPSKDTRAWLKNVTKFQSAVTDAMDEVRDSKVEKDIADAMDEAQEETQEQDIADAPSDMWGKDAKQHAATTSGQKLKPADTVGGLWEFKGKDLSMRNSHLLAKRRQSASKRFQKLQEMGLDKSEDYMGPSDASETPEQMQLILHPKAPNNLTTTSSSATDASDDREDQMYASMQEYTWPHHMPLHPGPYRMVASDENRAPASPKPVHRDLRHPSKQLVQESLTLGVGERESER
jgi:hypothetical protein